MLILHTIPIERVCAFFVCLFEWVFKLVYSSSSFFDCEHNNFQKSIYSKNMVFYWVTYVIDDEKITTNDKPYLGQLFTRKREKKKRKENSGEIHLYISSSFYFYTSITIMLSLFLIFFLSLVASWCTVENTISSHFNGHKNKIKEMI